MNAKRINLKIAFVLLLLAACLSACSPKPSTEEVTVATNPPPGTSEGDDPTVDSQTETPIPTEEASPTAEITPAPVPPTASSGKQGYISIPNTNVDYTVVIGEDNEYYLDRDINGKRDYHGAIFMDFRNASGDERRNIILYGHNMKDNTMFTTLHRFEREEFFKENEWIYFEMFGVKYKYQIVYAGMIDYRKHNHIHTVFASENAFLEYFEAGAENAQFVRDGYAPEPGDQMITLSTCVSHSIKDYDKKRMVVVGRMHEVLGEGEYSDAPADYTYMTAVDVFENRVEYANAMISMGVTNTSSSASADVIAPPGD